MRASSATELPWSTGLASQPDPEPDDLATCLAGPNGLDLVVEMAHDLRSPLTSIVLLAEALQSGQSGAVSAVQQRELGLIYSAALSLCGTASDVIELARGSTRLVDRQAVAFSVAELFGSVSSIVLPLAVVKGLEVRLVPPVPERRVGHARALARVVLNLATNAVKFTDAGVVEISARTARPARPAGLSRSPRRSRLEFAIRDTGPGIDPATLQVLYQPFRKRAAALRPEFSSSGLGLAICRKLVRAMGSELEVETRPGWGTRFSFTLDLPPATTPG